VRTLEHEQRAARQEPGLRFRSAEAAAAALQVACAKQQADALSAQAQRTDGAAKRVVKLMNRLDTISEEGPTRSSLAYLFKEYVDLIGGDPQ